MATVLIDGNEIALPAGQKLNGIQAARLAGVEIPHYCWHPGLSVVASCRMCLCETGTRDPATGKITMVPKLVPACQTPAADNAVFVTNSDKVKQARAMVEEDLLIDHPIDCPICDKAGECLLQDYHFEHGQAARRADVRPFTSRRRDMGDTVTLFVDRCVMCTRCVRFTREVTGTAELMVINRGSDEEIDVFPGHPLANKLSGNVVDLCPVGALGDKDFLYQQRVWFMEKHDHVCALCSTGCSITVEENQDRVFRLKPRENPHVNGWWMCDEGRYGYHHIHSEKRVTQARRREASGACLDADRPQLLGMLPAGRSSGLRGAYLDADWPQLLDEIDRKLREIAGGDDWLAAVISPFLTVEEAYLMAKYFRTIQPESRLVLGAVPVRGEDETFKNGFTIHAEKCPNRRGVEAVLRHFGGEGAELDDLWVAMDSGVFYEGIWLTGGYPEPEQLAWETAHDRPKLLIVHDLFETRAWQEADYQLPGPAYAERAGSYLNHANHLQSFDWAVRPPAGVWTEGQVFWRLLGMPGLYNPKVVMEEIAATIPFFAAAAAGVPSLGVQLSVDETVATSPVP